MARRNPPAMRPGIYNVEYFSGAQVALYIGDIWVDEITSISYAVSQNRVPLYGYADSLWRDVSKGPVMVQGQFTINFKEAGYLWLILNKYMERIKGRESLMTPFRSSSRVQNRNIEQLYNGEMSTFDRNRYFQTLVDVGKSMSEGHGAPHKTMDYLSKTADSAEASAQANLTGFADILRAQGGMGRAENKFEVFENAVWRKSQGKLDSDTRRADDPRLNPFDIYIGFGDFAGVQGGDYDNHTIQKISSVYIVGSSKQIVIDGQPIQEAYSFIARNLV